MLKKMKEIEYLILAKYYFIGVILAAIIYHFVSKSYINQILNINSIFGKEMIGLIIASVSGALVGGYIYYKDTISHSDRITKELQFWSQLKEKQMWFIITMITGGSIAGFGGQIVGVVIDMENYSNFFQNLFTQPAISRYLGIIFAGSVFGLFLSIGIIKRFKLLYGNV